MKTQHLAVGVYLHDQLKEWNNYIIKGVIIWWTETCSLYWTLRSYSTFVYWCTQIKGRVQIRVVREFCIAVNSGKMSILYFTENKGVLLSFMEKHVILVKLITLLNWNSSILKCSYLRIFEKGQQEGSSQTFHS